MKNLLAIFLVALTTFSAYAQDASNQKIEPTDPFYQKGQHFLGLNAGGSTGYGFSYKYLKNKVSFQLTGIPIFSEDDIYTSVGVQLTRRIGHSSFNNDPIHFNVYTGAHHIYNSYTSYIFPDYVGSTPQQTTSSDQQVNIAVGFGLEYIAMKKLSLNFNAGYGVRLDGAPATFFSAEAGIHYRLN